MKTMLLLLSFFFLWGCEKEMTGDFQGTQPIVLESTNIELVNGMLVFPNRASLDEVLKKPSSLDSSVPNFTSQKDIFNEIVKAESEQADIVNELTTKSISNVEIHSNLYKKYLKEGFIKIITYDDGTISYDLNSYAPYYSYVANKKGFFAIKDTIYQITPNSLKIWAGGDIYNYEELANYNKDDTIKHIRIFSNKHMTRTELPFNMGNQEIGIKSEDRKVGNIWERAMIIFYDVTTPIFNPPSYTRQTYAHIVYQKKIGTTNNYTYQNETFYLNTKVYTLLNNVADTVSATVSMTGSNEWYTFYLLYKMSASGKQDPYTTTENYCYLTKFWLFTQTYGEHSGAPLSNFGPFNLTGERQTPTNGPFMYSSDYTFSYLTELPE